MRAILDLATLTRFEKYSPSLTLAYRNADDAFFTVQSPANTNGDDWRGWSAELGLALSPSLDATLTLESGTVIGTVDERTGFVAEFVYPLAANTELTLTYSSATIPGVEEHEYEVQLAYEWN